MKYTENDVFVLRDEEIKAATEMEYRQYFSGNLKRPQLLNYIQTENLEIGTSVYKTFTADEPHLHKLTSDMVYILQGEYHVWLLEKETSPMVMKKGDFISIPKNCPYASKAKAGTETLFIKQLKESDKVVVTPSPEVKQWMGEEI